MDIGTIMSRRSTSDLIIENDESVHECFDDARELPNSKIPPTKHRLRIQNLTKIH